jgi:cellulose synthase/poly-beta-1,6-N-acetylglucosamine synthase-like glycosyltransferase
MSLTTMPASAIFSLKIVFWICASVLTYVYFGYPLLIGIFAKLFPLPSQSSEAFEPPVTLLISAFNESPVIASKLENSLALEYPVSQLEIIVISDCSDDGTDDIVRQYANRGVSLIRQNRRLGKSAGLNLAVPMARGEFLVFSDANAIYQRDAIHQLIRHFSSPKVGYVVGNARYFDKSAPVPSAVAEGLYWKLETWLKKQESAFDSVVGGDGAIYAIRSHLYSALRSTDINDFMNPLQIVDRGYRGLFEPRAISFEDTAESFQKEFQRKIRIVSRSLNALRRVSGVLNPFHNSRHWFLLVSHKLLRWLAAFFLPLMFAASLLLWNYSLYRFAFVLQAVLYVFGVTGWIVPGSRTMWKPFSLAYYFCLVNLASFIGCVKCLRGDLSATWTPPRQTAGSEN